MGLVQTRYSSGRLKQFAPILIAEAYLSFTVFVFAFGPWPWPVENPFTLYTYLCLAQGALFFGYLTATHDAPMTYMGRFSCAGLLKTSVILNLIWVIPNFYRMAGSAERGLRGIVAGTMAGAADPGQAYQYKLLQNSGSLKYVDYAHLLFLPILWLSVPLGIAAWKVISLRMKAAIVFIVVANAAAWVALGTTKGIADNAMIVVISLMATRKSLTRHRESFAFLKKLPRIAMIAGSLFAVMLFFSVSKTSRISEGASLSIPGAGIRLDSSNLLIAGMPTALQPAVGMGTSYLCQGYYGLSLTLEEPFQWSWGIGHSLYLSSLMQKLTGFDTTTLTYPARAQHTGWDMLAHWQTIYPWLASDVTFPGTLVILFLIGRLFASTWADVQSGKNPYALPLFLMLMIMIFYFPANNQILAFETVGAFWVLLCAWLLTRYPIRESRVRIWN